MSEGMRLTLEALARKFLIEQIQACGSCRREDPSTIGGGATLADPVRTGQAYRLCLEHTGAVAEVLASKPRESVGG